MLREARTGRIEVSLVTCSVLWTSSCLLLRKASTTPHTMPDRSVHENMTQMFRVAALCSSFVAAVWDKRHWPATSTLAYIWLLGFLRLHQSGSIRSTLLHQSAIMSLILFVVMFMNDSMPRLIINTTYPFHLLALASTGFTFMSIATLATTPREWVLPLDGLTTNGARITASMEEKASWLDYWCTFGRMTALVLKGGTGNVTLDDMDDLPWEYQPCVLLLRIKSLRQQYKTTAKTLFFLIWQDLCFAMAFASLFFATELVIPFGMYNLLEYLHNPEKATFQPIIWLFIMVAGRVFGTVVQQQLAFQSGRASLKIKIALTSEIYDQAMQSREPDHEFLSNTAGRNKKSSIGLLTNLMSSDIRTIMQGRVMIMVLFGGPIGGIFGLFGLYRIVGWPCLVGVGITLLGSPITAWISNRVAVHEEILKDAQDSRISLSAEYLRSIKIVKYFGWEDVVENVVTESREREQKHLWSLALLSTAVTVITYSVPTISLLAIFALYSETQGKELTASVAYTTISLLEIVRDNASGFSAISIYVPKIRIALNRIDRYFAAVVPCDKHAEGALLVQKATFRRSISAAFKLCDVSIEFIQEGLNVVTGQSGSGKTTLLLSILGETVLEFGHITAPRNIAFASQSPWLQAQSLRSNILFTAEYDAGRYEAIIKACCLDIDLKELPNGDMTEIGENGQALSGIPSCPLQSILADSP